MRRHTYIMYIIIHTHTHTHTHTRARACARHGSVNIQTFSTQIINVIILLRYGWLVSMLILVMMQDALLMSCPCSLRYTHIHRHTHHTRLPFMPTPLSDSIVFYLIYVHVANVAMVRRNNVYRCTYRELFVLL